MYIHMCVHIVIKTLFLDEDRGCTYTRKNVITVFDQPPYDPMKIKIKKKKNISLKPLNIILDTVRVLKCRTTA